MSDVPPPSPHPTDRVAGRLSVGTDPQATALERLSTKELHDLAVRRARRHLDVRFFWRLMEVLPVAEAGAGRADAAQADLQRASAHLDDITESGRGEVAELLRPFYLDYLTRHGAQAR